jgi:uncharacterized membrane protein YraQ (UPF0718 family)
MERQRTKSAPGGWLFLLAVLAAYGVTGAIDAGAAGQALSFFVKAMRNVLPALAVVFLLLLAADLLFEREWITRNLGREAGISAWFIAAVGGVLAAGPVYAWYALLRELREKGMRASVAAVFLYSRAVKLPLLPLMIHYFGSTYTLVLCLYLFGFSIVSGVLMVQFDDRETSKELFGPP